MRHDPAKNTAVKETFLGDAVTRKFSKPLVLVFLAAVSLAVGYVFATRGLAGGLLALAVIIGIPVVIAAVAYPKFGIIVFIILSFLINDLSRVFPEDMPIGLAMDVFTYLLILGFFVKQKGEKRWDYFNDPISWIIVIWLSYNLLEVINPIAASRLAWLYTVRTVGFIMLLYFVFVFQIRSKSFIKLLIIVWLLLAMLGAMSAFQQEIIGFFTYEKNWLLADPLRVSLLFINGHMRKFGIFSDPVVFAFNMVAASLLCIALLFSDIKPHKKVILGLMAAFFIWVMLYSGTRGAYVLIPAAMVMLTILKFSKKLLAFVVFAGVLLFFLIVVPTSNATLIRFQSAFKPSKDASFNVRAENQARIKPYILSHPIGGGLGSVGIWGQRFAPNSYLAKFPPDSGYVRVAVEMGWIGLLLFCIFNFVVLYRGIYYYYVIKDPRLKTYCLAMILIIFAFNIGNYPQQAFVQYPSNILFYLAIAIMSVTMRLDVEQNKLQQ
jgi:O-antigen ligase